MDKTKKIIVLGFGGQGVLFTAKILANAAFNNGFKSSYLPTYGPSVQNLPVKAEIVISDQEIHNPFIEKADYIIVLHRLCFEDALKQIKQAGLIFCKDFSTDINTDLTAISIETEEVTEQLKNSLVANTVMLGAFIERTGLIEDKSIGESIKQYFSSKQHNLVTLNFKAYKKGKEIITANV